MFIPLSKFLLHLVKNTQAVHRACFKFMKIKNVHVRDKVGSLVLQTKFLEYFASLGRYEPDIYESAKFSYTMSYTWFPHRQSSFETET